MKGTIPSGPPPFFPMNVWSTKLFIALAGGCKRKVVQRLRVPLAKGTLGWFVRNPANSPVEGKVVCSLSHDLHGFFYIPGGWEWDFGQYQYL